MHFATTSPALLRAVEARLWQQPVVVLCLQRSGSNLLRQSIDERFVLPAYEFRNGSDAERYCIPCAVAAGRTTSPECATKDFVRVRRTNGVEVRAPMVHVRGAPGSAHFHFHATSFTVDGFYSKCGFPSIQSYAIRSIADVNAIYGSSATFLVAVKDPLAWFISAHRFWKMNCTAIDPTKCIVRSVSGRTPMLDLWVNYYGNWLSLIDDAVLSVVGFVRDTSEEKSEVSDASPAAGAGGGRAAASQAENLVRVATASRSVSIVRYEDMLTAPRFVLEQLQWRHAWADRDASEKKTFDPSKLQVHVSLDANFNGKKQEYAKRRFLEQIGLPDGIEGAGRPLGWFERNCATLSAYFNQTDVDERLGYDLGYVHNCYNNNGYDLDSN